MRKRCAFTLIELLVVIAIIALLVPSLARARDMARKAVCSTTISNHGKSVAMCMSLLEQLQPQVGKPGPPDPQLRVG